MPSVSIVPRVYVATGFSLVLTDKHINEFMLAILCLIILQNINYFQVETHDYSK